MDRRAQDGQAPDQRTQDQVDPALWHRTDMRIALAARDIAGVFRLLQRVGVSQRRIAALTGQSQPYQRLPGIVTAMMDVRYLRISFAPEAKGVAAKERARLADLNGSLTGQRRECITVERADGAVDVTEFVD